MGNELLASKIVIQEEEPQFRPVVGVATAILGMVGVTEKGPVGVATLCQSIEEYRKTFGSYVAAGDVAQAVDGFFSEGGSQCWVTRTVHYSDITIPASKTSAKATLNLNTASAAPSSGSVTGSVLQPWDLEPGDTLVVAVDGGAPSTATFNATAAARECANAEPYVLVNNQNITVKVDGGSVQTIAFLTSEFVSIGAATAEEVAAVINAKIVGAYATVTSGGTKVTITSDKRGTGSHIEVTGGTANGALGFNTAVVDGTGNVVNIDAVTVAEAITIVNAAVAGQTATSASGALKLTSNTTGGSSSVQVQASSTADDELGFDNAVHSGGAGGAVATLRVDGKWDGAYANRCKAVVAAASSGEAAYFNFSVMFDGLIVEVFPNVSMVDTDPNYIETVVNDPDNGSRYVAVVDLDAALSSPLDQPAPGTSAFLSGGSDGLVGLVDSDYIGSTGVTGKTGIRALDLVADLSLLAVPGRATSAVHAAMLVYCEVTRSKQVFAVLDPPASQTAQQMVTYTTTTAALENLTEFGAIYWPRIKVSNPARSVFGNTDQYVVPPSGHIAGVYARTDNASPGGVYQPPAGVERGIIFSCLGFETDETLDESKRDLVFPKRINPITTGPGLPRYIDGARTLKGNGNFPSVSERRGVIFIEQSIKGALQFARHSNNDENLRERCDRITTVFLTDQMTAGAFRSKDPETAFFVDFGDALNPVSAQFAGKLTGRIGLATNKPAEFIILRFSQDTRSLEAATA